MGEHHSNPQAIGTRSSKAAYIVSRMLKFASGHIVCDPMQIFASEDDAKTYMDGKGAEYQRHHDALSPALSVLGIVAVGFSYAPARYESGTGIVIAEVVPPAV
jgi:hypothetical protein